jgi:hypothetical protein
MHMRFFKTGKQLRDRVNRPAPSMAGTDAAGIDQLAVERVVGAAAAARNRHSRSLRLISGNGRIGSTSRWSKSNRKKTGAAALPTALKPPVAKKLRTNA